MIHYEPLPPGFEPSEMLNGDHHCPSCSQQTFLRKVTLSGQLVHALRIIQQAPNSTVKGSHMAKYGRSIYCNYTQLKYWGLIQEDRANESWRITEEGIAFLNSEMRLPTSLYVFADQVRGLPLEIMAEIEWAAVDEIKPYNPITSRAIARQNLTPLVHE